MLEETSHITFVILENLRIRLVEDHHFYPIILRSFFEVYLPNREAAAPPSSFLFPFPLPQGCDTGDNENGTKIFKSGKEGT